MLIEIVITLAIAALAVYIFFKNVKKKSQGNCCSSSSCTAHCECCEMKNEEHLHK